MLGAIFGLAATFVHAPSRLASGCRLRSSTPACAAAFASELAAATAAVREASLRARSIQDEIVRTAAAHSKQDVDGTGFGVSPVTVADFAVQILVISALHHAFPDDRYIAEESGAELLSAGEETVSSVLAAVGGSFDRARALELLDLGVTGTRDGWSSSGGRTWVLDPIDGTKGFLRGASYAVALSLLSGGRPVVGVLGCPNLGEGGTLFSAVLGDGAYSAPIDGGERQRLRVGVPSEPRRGIVRCESYEAGHTSHGVAGAVAESLGIAARPVRMDGQGKYGLVASGEAHLYTRLPRPGYVENIWDHCAGALIVEEAGGRVTDLEGNALRFSLGKSLARGVRGIVASNGECHDDVLRALGQSAGAESS